MFYLNLFAALERHAVDYLLVGGLAVSLHGIERSTMDIDICVAMSRANLASLVAMARELEMTPQLPVPLDTLTDLETLREWHEARNLVAFALKAPGLTGVTLDILLFPPIAFEEMRPRAVCLHVGGTTVQLVGIRDLISLKEAVGRPIDQADIAHLRRMHGL
ncbi:MAG: hypothetical protein VKP62_04765 [Candidatus Sericytochromatia bacterium]|nr:hypothetical protein [Candidatus Sericytochromatia bacterium]